MVGVILKYVIRNMEFEGVCFSHLAHNRGVWLSVVNIIINLGIPLNTFY